MAPTWPLSACNEGLVDEVLVYVLPVLLGDGVRFSTPGLGKIDLEPFSNTQSGPVTMLRFRMRTKNRHDLAAEAGSNTVP